MKKFALLTLLVFTTAMTSPALLFAQAQSKAAPLSIPVTGSGSGGTFAGTFQLQKFANDQGQLVATGVLSGVVTTATGATTSVFRTVAIPAAVSAPTSHVSNPTPKRAMRRVRRSARRIASAWTPGSTAQIAS